MSYPTLFTTPGMKTFAEDVDTERQAQLAKWGDQRHPDIAGDATIQCDLREKFAEEADYYRSLNSRGSGPDWSGILLEEVYEAVAEADSAKLRAELVQVAAVCAAWISDLDRRADALSQQQEAGLVVATYRVQCAGCRGWLSLPDGHQPGTDLHAEDMACAPTAERAGLWPTSIAAHQAATRAGWRTGHCPACH